MGRNPRLLDRLVGGSLYGLRRGLFERVMFEWLHYRYQLALLQRKKRQTQRYFTKALNKARKEQKSVDDLQGLGAEETHELDFIDDDIHQLISNYVRSEAEKHFVPVLRFNLTDGKWERSEVSDRYRLTREGSGNYAPPSVLSGKKALNSPAPGSPASPD